MRPNAPVSPARKTRPTDSAVSKYVERTAATRRWLRGLLLLLFTVVTLLIAALYPLLSRGSELLHSNFQHRWFLLALVIVPLVFWRGTLGEDRRTPRLSLGTLAPLRVGPSGLRVWLRDLPGVVRSVGLILGIL